MLGGALTGASPGEDTVLVRSCGPLSSRVCRKDAVSCAVALNSGAADSATAEGAGASAIEGP